MKLFRICMLIGALVAVVCWPGVRVAAFSPGPNLVLPKLVLPPPDDRTLYVVDAKEWPVYAVAHLSVNSANVQFRGDFQWQDRCDCFQGRGPIRASASDQTEPATAVATVEWGYHSKQHTSVLVVHMLLPITEPSIVYPIQPSYWDELYVSPSTVTAGQTVTFSISETGFVPHPPPPSHIGKTVHLWFWSAHHAWDGPMPWKPTCQCFMVRVKILAGRHALEPVLAVAIESGQLSHPAAPDFATSVRLVKPFSIVGGGG